ALAALAALVTAWAARRPLVLALEDLHWADDSSLDALARMAEALAESPAFILANARPGLFARRPLWGEGERGHVRLDLRPLTPAAVGRLVRAILEDESVPEDVVRFVAERSEGNAFYVEELTRMLQDRGMLERGESGWRVDLARVEEGRVPTTLQGMLQARLDALPPSAREALQRASILGRNFWAGALAALGSGEASLLEALREQGLVLARERSSIAGEREYVFKHALLRDAAYGSLLKRQRPVLHALAADWLIDHAGERYAELAAQIARHAELAGRAAEAARHYRAAAERARATYANADAVAQYRKACELWPAEDEAGRFACIQGGELALDMLGQREEQRESLDKMGAVAEQLDDAARSYVHYRRSWLALRTGDDQGAETEARRALTLANEAVKAGADARINLGNALRRQKRFDEAMEQFEAALDLLGDTADERSIATALLGLATTAESAKDFETARQGFERALAIFERLDDVYNQAATVTNLAIFNAMQGQLDEAAPRFEAALQLYRAAGDRAGEGKALHNLGFLDMETGDYASAESHLRQARAIYQAVSQSQGEADVIRDLREVLRRSGREAEAQALTLPERA
ncbi:MAG: tetratricopeptide repeat protein, partial [Chloroflexi bacterium]|nr:tetratricopeptide repeat protein [Chloroflexota bacterium]